MSIIFMTTPVIMAFHAGLRETEGFMPAAILISGLSWLLAAGYCCIAEECNADFANSGFRHSLGRSQRKPGVLKLPLEGACGVAQIVVEIRQPYSSALLMGMLNGIDLRVTTR